MAYGCSIWRVECGMWDKSIAVPHPTLTRDSAAWSRGVSQCQCASVQVCQCCVCPLFVFILSVEAVWLSGWWRSEREKATATASTRPVGASGSSQCRHWHTEESDEMSARRKRYEEEGEFCIPGLGDRNYRPGQSSLSSLWPTFTYRPVEGLQHNNYTASQLVVLTVTWHLTCHLTSHLTMVRLRWSQMVTMWVGPSLLWWVTNAHYFHWAPRE